MTIKKKDDMEKKELKKYQEEFDLGVDMAIKSILRLIDKEYRREELDNLRAETYRLGTCKSSKYKTNKLQGIREIFNQIYKEREELKLRIQGK